MKLTYRDAEYQATHEISKDQDRTAQGHGPTWQAWMRKIGLNPSRFDSNDNYTYESKQETEGRKEKFLRDVMDAQASLVRSKAIVSLSPDEYDKYLNRTGEVHFFHSKYGMFIATLRKGKAAGKIAVEVAGDPNPKHPDWGWGDVGQGLSTFNLTWGSPQIYKVLTQDLVHSVGYNMRKQNR